eukprot:882574-Alexandrium_andersonii.AAC.1
MRYLASSNACFGPVSGSFGQLQNKVCSPPWSCQACRSHAVTVTARLPSPQDLRQRRVGGA